MNKDQEISGLEDDFAAIFHLGQTKPVLHNLSQSTGLIIALPVTFALGVGTFAAFHFINHPAGSVQPRQTTGRLDYNPIDLGPPSNPPNVAESTHTPHSAHPKRRRHVGATKEDGTGQQAADDPGTSGTASKRAKVHNEFNDLQGQGLAKHIAGSGGKDNAKRSDNRGPADGGFQGKQDSTAWRKVHQREQADRDARLSALDAIQSLRLK